MLPHQYSHTTLYLFPFLHHLHGAKLLATGVLLALHCSAERTQTLPLLGSTVSTELEKSRCLIKGEKWLRENLLFFNSWSSSFLLLFIYWKSSFLVSPSKSTPSFSEFTEPFPSHNMYHDLIGFWSSLLCCPWLVRAMTIPFPPPLYRARSGFGSEHTWTIHQIKYWRVKDIGRVSVSHLRSAILHIWCPLFAQIISWPSLFIEGIKMSINK